MHDVFSPATAPSLADSPVAITEVLQRGLAHFRAGRSAEAEAACRLVLATQPDHAEALHLAGLVTHRLQRHPQAEDLLRRAIAADPAQPHFHRHMALVLADLGRPEAAEVSAREALRLRPAYPEALYSLGAARHALGRPAEAEADFRAAVRLRPDYPEAHNGLAVALVALGRLAEAEASCNAALRLQPGYGEAHNNLGTIQLRQNRAAEAAASYRTAIRLQPDAAGAHANLGMALLLDGRFEEGWREYEWRWQTQRLGHAARNFRGPLWAGEPIDGRVLLLHAEQGLGDTLQFCRYAPLLARQTRVLLEVQPPLVRLLSGLPGVARVFARGEPPPAFDLHCPLLSLPRACGTTLETIPAATPYLAADPAEAAAWQARLAHLPGVRVGLVWAGRARSHNPELAATDARRSLALALLAPLGAVAGVSFLSLQQGPPAAQAPPPGLALADFSADLNDFADTAALIENLDLVISVDTAVAHLAGALGKPVWLLNRFDTCWRWLLQREDSPWYPTLRQFRQPAPGDWASVVGRVRDALHLLAAGDRRQFVPSPDTSAALLQQAAADHAAGRLAEAEAGLRTALQRRPGFAEAQYGLGLILQQRDRPAEAEACFRAVLRLRPDYPEALNGLAVVLLARGRAAEAEASCRAALRLRPAFADALNGLGTILFAQNRLGEAEACLREALRLRPASPSALNNLGNTLFALGRPVRAALCYREALRLKPAFADAQGNFGTALAALGRPADADAAYREALRLRPGHAGTHANRAMALLLDGRFAEGWREYEWRWQSKHLQPAARNFGEPQWAGEPLDGRVLLLHAEQGLGDTLQFCRYAPLLARQTRVLLEVQPPLVRLLSGLPGVARVFARGQPLPAFDLHCPLLSLPHACGTTLETIPAATPYLTADPAEAAAWRARLAHLPGVRVGLVWAGRARPGETELAATDARRSLALAMLAPLGAVAGVSFLSLQQGPPAAQAPPPGLALADFTADLHDFADTAALIENLDLVISVDTAVAHLAGALGKPVWLLNRFDTCWRWLLQREDSPWYPTLRQFRQPAPGDWASVVGRVRDALQRLAAGAREPPQRHAGPAPADTLFRRARADHQAGRLAEAETACREVLAVEPRHAEALHLMGLIAHQSRRSPQAAQLIREAIAIDGSQPSYHRHLALVLSDLGRPADAEASLRTALRLRPDYPEAHHSLGIALAALGRPAEAEASYREALRLRPDFPEALNGLAVALLALARPAEADASCREALLLRPDYADAHNTLGSALLARHRPVDAEACLREALRLRPAYPAACVNLGHVLSALSRPAEAEAQFREALRLQPQSPERLAELAAAQHAQAHFADAEASFRKALRLQPDHPGAHNGLGNVLYALGRPGEAEASYRAALRGNPDFADALGNLGRALAALGRPAEADATYRALLRQRPEDADAHANRGMALLLDGRFAEGWRDYEWRWRTRYMAGADRRFAAPQWDGAALGERVLLLHAEQGLGDTLQFCRYAPLLARQARVLLEVQPPLVRLLSGLPGVARVFARGEPPPAFDLHSPLLSLPRACGTTLETIPAATPYLTADPAEAAAWQARLAHLPGVRVGLVWAGRARSHNPELAATDARRSLALAMLAPLGAVAGVSFLSLQQGPPAAQAPPPGLALADFSADLHDFADTAALIENLDLVISVDTAVAHLAGALGKPVWLLNRFDTCWRWLLQREDSPWYPTLRQFRQPAPGDWASVVGRVRDALQRLAAGAVEVAREPPSMMPTSARN